LTNWLVYLAVRLFVCIVQSLRIETCAVLAQLISVVAVDLVRIRQNVVDDNLRHVFPSLSSQGRLELSRAMWEHLVLMACETAHAPRKIHRTNWYRHVQIARKHELVRHLLDTRPTLMVSGHFGNFELGGFVTGVLGFPTYTVARRLDNPLLDRYVNRFRSANGQFIVPKENSARQIDHLLATGAALTLLGDQHAGAKGCWVDFFGRPASCHKAIALFALTSKAPLLVVYTKRLKRPMRFEVGLADVVDPVCCDSNLVGVRPLTQWYNRRLERLVHREPHQYWWLHRRWKGAPPAA
jgi:KDO2-lipid IV(A) lauroyltransferase